LVWSVPRRCWADIPPPDASSAPLTLQDCYRRALHVSETLAIDQATIQQLEAQYRQGISAVLPTLTWIKTQEFQDTPNNQTNSSGSVQGTLLRSPIPQSYFELDQPLFHGLRELNALKGFKSARIAGEKTLEQARLSLLDDVAQVFYTSIDLQLELDLYGREHQITEDRIKQLKHWVDLGRSRSSEVLSTQVDLVSLEAQMEQTRAALQTARITLQFLTEIPPTTPLVDNRPDPAPETLDKWLLHSVNRPDLQASAENRRAAEYQLRYARGGWWPSLDFTGKWYTERVGFQQDDRWDALFTLQVPLFSGGDTVAQIKLAQAQYAVADLNDRRLTRQARQDVQNAYQTLTQSIKQAALYDRAASLARDNYQVQTKEYKLGLITNLEVLQVLKTQEDLEIQSIRSHATAKQNDVSLRVLAGVGL